MAQFWGGREQSLLHSCRQLIDSQTMLIKKSQTQKDSTYVKFQNRQNSPLMTGIRISMHLQGADWQRGLRELAGVLEVFHILNLVVITQPHINT